MAKTKKELPLAPLERILRNAGAKRVSKEAVKEFSAVVADYAHRDHASRAPHSPGAEKMRNFSDKENAYLGRWDLLGLAGKE